MKTNDSMNLIQYNFWNKYALKYISKIKINV